MIHQSIAFKKVEQLLSAQNVSKHITKWDPGAQGRSSGAVEFVKNALAVPIWAVRLLRGFCGASAGQVFARQVFFCGASAVLLREVCL